MGMLSVGVTGLNAAQLGLQTTGHNITNASTRGFNRQQVIQTTNTPLFSGGGFIGQGTNVDSIKRVYSAVLANQVLTAESSAAELKVYSDQITQIDNLLADSSAGLSPAMQQFFNAIDLAAANSSSVPSRQAMLSGAESLVSQFKTLNQRLDGIRSSINDQIRTEVATINSYVRQIADINQRIVLAQAAGPEVPANDLLDQRDTLISDLNKEIRLTIHEESDGTLSLFLGTGQPLLVASAIFQLEVLSGKEDISQLTVGMVDPAGASITLEESLVAGGTLGGLLKFRSETLDVAQNSLGRVAITMASDFNAQHMLGQDLNGALGQAFFDTSAASQLLIPSAENIGNADLKLTLSSPTNLTTSDYRLSLTSSGVLSLVRLSDNMAWTGSGATQAQAVSDLMANVNTSGSQGFDLSLASGTMTAGDTVLIRPTRYGARDISVAIKDVRAIALAAPVRTSASIANAGTASISAGAVDNTSALPVATITLSYSAVTNSLSGFPVGASVSVAGDLTSPHTIVGAGTGVPYISGAEITFNGMGFSITGAPVAGDQFMIGSNPSGVGDSRNAILLGNLQTQKSMQGGTATYQSSYAQIVSQIGNKAREVQVTYNAQESLAQQGRDAIQSFSGVNLDEEAANLLRYQQAYQASAKMIEVAGRIFDELLALGR